MPTPNLRFGRPPKYMESWYCGFSESNVQNVLLLINYRFICKDTISSIDRVASYSANPLVQCTTRSRLKSTDIVRFVCRYGTAHCLQYTDSGCWKSMAAGFHLAKAPLPQAEDLHKLLDLPEGR